MQNGLVFLCLMGVQVVMQVFKFATILPFVGRKVVAAYRNPLDLHEERGKRGECEHNAVTAI